MSADQNISERILCLPASLLLCAWALVFCSEPCFSEPSADQANKQEIRSAFESLTVKSSLPPGKSEITVSWNYVNHSDAPLVFERFEESCGCLHGTMDQQPVPPGKTGTIRANFTAGSYRGILRKSLHVRFVGHNESVELVAEVSIPSSVELSKQELLWNPADGSTEQTIEVTSGTGANFNVTGLLGVPDSRFTITQEAIDEGKHYRLRITPKGTPEVGTQCLQVRTDSPDPRDRVLAVFLQVVAPPSDPTIPTQSAPALPSGAATGS